MKFAISINKTVKFSVINRINFHQYYNFLTITINRVSSPTNKLETENISNVQTLFIEETTDKQERNIYIYIHVEEER